MRFKDFIGNLWIMEETDFASMTPRVVLPLFVIIMQSNRLLVHAFPFRLFSSSSSPKVNFFAKRKRAVLFGYNGAGFKGLQSQIPNSEDRNVLFSDFSISTTRDNLAVEDLLHFALFQAGAISSSNCTSLDKIGWSRSSRTDRGVHAASQIICAKLMIPFPEDEETGDVSRQDEAKFVSIVNEHLPESIRVFRVQRVRGGFDARYFTESRRYGYLLPSALLDVLGIASLNRVLQEFVGTHSFHNFTEFCSPKDPRSRRLIYTFTAEATGQGILLNVMGQSFLKLQIRKMVGYAVESVLRAQDEETAVAWVREALQLNHMAANRTVFPVAPPEPLFLDCTYFKPYNKIVLGSSREPIDFEEESVNAQRVHFLHDCIFPEISSNNAFLTWLKARQEEADFPPSWFIPDETILVQMEQERKTRNKEETQEWMKTASAAREYRK